MSSVMDVNIKENTHDKPIRLVAYSINYFLAFFFLLTAFLKVYMGPHFDYGKYLFGHKERHPYGGFIFFGIAFILIFISTTILLLF